MSDPLKIFICYAREDRDPLEMLRKKLTPLVHSGRIQVWYDREITGGKEWDHEIRFNLKTADVVLLLISDDFFESDYIKSVELREALDGHARQENVVVPIILYDCLWDAHHELSRLQALPEEAKPIFVEEHWKKPDQGFANVARGVLRVLDDPATQERRARKLTRLEQLAAAEAEEREARKRKEEAERQVKEREARAQMEEAERQAKERETRKRKEEMERAEKEKEEQKRREEAIQSFIDMVPVQGAAFQFGDKIKVTVSDFMIGKYPVTQKQWREIIGNNPAHFKGDDLPVESVSWEEAKAFIKKLNERFPGNNYRLPSEAEWEYAARGGRLSKGYEYAGSDNLEEVGWFWENSGDKPLSGEWALDKIEKNNGRTHPVGQKKANELGIYDMSGNVWEWCEDDWHDAIAGIPKDGAPWIDQPKRGVNRVNRGGGWIYGAGSCRVSSRDRNAPDGRSDYLGFRLVSSPRR